MALSRLHEDIIDFHEIIGKQRAEIERLTAIIDKLPKTADGVPVVPGMTVYYRGMGGVVQTTNEMCVNAIKAANGFILNPSGCYSTQVAADAAGGE